MAQPNDHSQETSTGNEISAADAQAIVDRLNSTRHVWMYVSPEGTASEPRVLKNIHDAQTSLRRVQTQIIMMYNDIVGTRLTNAQKKLLVPVFIEGFSALSESIDRANEMLPGVVIKCTNTLDLINGTRGQTMDLNYNVPHLVEYIKNL